MGKLPSLTLVAAEQRKTEARETRAALFQRCRAAIFYGFLVRLLRLVGRQFDKPLFDPCRNLVERHTMFCYRKDHRL